MASIYSTDDGHAPPLPHLQTWALGFQIQDHRVIEDKVLPLMKRKMDRLDASEYDTFYEDEPEGFGNANLLSREKCLAWVQSIADHLMDSEDSDQKEIVLYEFSDRPEGFPNPQLPEVCEPWKRAIVGIFNGEARNEGASGPERFAATLSPVDTAGAAKPDGLTGAATDNGAGPSRPLNTRKEDDNRTLSMENSKRQKIAGIRAALQYNGYPSTVIEDLLENKLWLHPKAHKNSCQWRLQLPNGKSAATFSNIDANPYPGGKITELSARKCVRSENCTKQFGHHGSCASPENTNAHADVQNEDNRTGRNKLIEPIQKGQEPLADSEERTKEKGNVIRWRLRLPNGIIADSYDTIDANPYPGGKITEKTARKCARFKDCFKPFGHAAGCLLDKSDEIDETNPLFPQINHITFGVRTALVYAGYPIEIVEEIMKNDFRITAYPDSKSQKYGWSLKMPNGKRVSRKREIQANPYPGGNVTVNPICHTLGYDKEFGHIGQCPIHPTGRYKVKREADTGPVSPSPVTKKSRAMSSPSSLSNLPPRNYQKPMSPQQIAESISRKKTSLLNVLEQARYPTPVARELVEKAIYKPNGVDRNGNIILKFTMRLPNGTSAGNDESILLNPYSIAGGGFFGGSYTLQGSRSIQKKLVQKEGIDEKERTILSSSSDDEEEKEESDKEEEPRQESPIYLLTTEEEDNSEEEGEDEYSSLED